jgi:photosystem II stability/assembly factor-like uncharacterized protein
LATAGRRPTLNAVQFLSASNGWVVGSDRILHTTDGGQHWTVQLRTSQAAGLGGVDFTDAMHGWVVGAKDMLATTDGGAHWRSLPEPCPMVRTVHFVNSQDGFAVARGSAVNSAQPPYAAGPPSGGILLHTTDGGVHWRRLSAPADVQTVCFSHPGRGWLGAGGNIYRTADSGQTWTLALHGPGTPAGSPESHAIADVQCAGTGAAWAQLTGPGVGMSHMAQIGYHTDGMTWRPIYAEQYTASASLRKHVPAGSPGSYPGPFTAISPNQAVFIGWCPACTIPASPRMLGPAPMAIALHGGSVLLRRSRITDLTEATGAAFLSIREGWVVGIGQGSNATSMIMHTADGGRTWQAQFRMGSG